MTPIELEGFVSGEALSRAVPWIKGTFFVLLGWLFLRLGWGGGKGKGPAGKANRVCFGVIAVLLGGIYAYQATWQLAGFQRSEFVEFMRKYNRRPDNPAGRLLRGSITDRQGVVLARTDPERPGAREYPLGPVFAHVVGYVHPVYGMTGVERSENGLLSGQMAESREEWRRFGLNVIDRSAIRGHDVQLTLDAELQKVAMRGLGDRKGAVVVLDPRDGSVLALASAPSFDPNRLTGELFQRGEAMGSPLLNRAIQGLYPPGSAFKPFVAAVALEAGLQPMIDCPAEGFVAGTGNRPIRDHEYYDHERRGRVWKGHGTIGMREAMAKSSNVYFARLGLMAGGAKLHESGMAWGFTRRWTVHRGASGDMVSSAGRMPALTEKMKAQTAQISIGQGELVVTPLHMAMMTAAMARDGVMWEPRLTGRGAGRPLDPVMSPSTARGLGSMLRHTVTSGTGTGADVPGLRVAGKTGTAQNPTGRDHSWFVCYAPVDQPRLVIAVVVEEGGYGSRAAVPIAAEVLKRAEGLGWFGGGGGL
ncbi:MAG TPA: penicillin-binding transpeptidase domain-containing protein [Kiritimatiellia bacterium]|nr:penicillin-binding transpeptidase domain-containing protein [Kiritimatiellia bacterium]